jgi:AcrR family transcriptional regulator
MSAQSQYPSADDIMKQRLMDGCISCIAEKGIDKTSIRDIAEASGIARQTVYKHFSNKHEILAAALQREGLNFALEVADYIRDFSDIEEKFIFGFIYVVEHFNSNPILAAVLAPGSTFLKDVGMQYFNYADFGQIVYQDVFAKYPALAAHSEAISELWIRNSLSYIAMPGPEKSRQAFISYIKERLIPGIGLQAITDIN